MTETNIKKAVESAEKELNEQEIEQLKTVVKSTLSQISDIDKQIDELQERKRYLKLDIDDLKNGRLDRIEERQQKDSKARGISIIVIHKETVREINNPYYIPYYVEVVRPRPYYPSQIIYSTTTSASNGMTDASPAVVHQFKITGALSRSYTPGAYKLADDSVINLR